MSASLTSIYHTILHGSPPSKPPTKILAESAADEYPQLAQWIAEHQEDLQYLIDSLPHTQPASGDTSPSVDSVLVDMLSDVLDVWLDQTRKALDNPEEE